MGIISEKYMKTYLSYVHKDGHFDLVSENLQYKETKILEALLVDKWM